MPVSLQKDFRMVFIFSLELCLNVTAERQNHRSTRYSLEIIRAAMGSKKDGPGRGRRACGGGGWALEKDPGGRGRG